MNNKLLAHLQAFLLCCILCLCSLSLAAQCPAGTLSNCHGQNDATGCCYVYDALGNLDNCTNARCVDCIGMQAPPGGYECWQAANNCNACLLSLPIELLSFQVEPQELGNLIHWQTASEYNTMLFSIERSANGQDEWEEVGKVQPVGFSEDIQSYSLMDYSPLQLGYYRLRSTDFDGQYQLFDVAAADRQGEAEGQMRLFPNPIRQSELAVYFSLTQTSRVQLRITDMAGKIVYAEQTEGYMGINQRQIDLSRQEEGIYFVYLKTNAGEQVMKLVKAKG
ncbi:MAG: T9SS type A sorting domain-containing protein [Bacteroidota bacterium]